jgi:hypothetical protein
MGKNTTAFMPFHDLPTVSLNMACFLSDIRMTSAVYNDRKGGNDMCDNRNVKSTGPDDASGLVVFAEAIPDVILEIHYYSTYNFIGERIYGYEELIARLFT